jgi:hypothetical protein
MNESMGEGGGGILIEQVERNEILFTEAIREHSFIDEDAVWAAKVHLSAKNKLVKYNVIRFHYP